MTYRTTGVVPSSLVLFALTVFLSALSPSSSPSVIGGPDVRGQGSDTVLFFAFPWVFTPALLIAASLVSSKSDMSLLSFMGVPMLKAFASHEVVLALTVPKGGILPRLMLPCVTGPCPRHSGPLITI